MYAEILSLSLPAVSLGFIHCVCGPDHYVPFIAMSRVGLWSLRKTLVITVLCGVGHVLSSAVIGFIGVALGLIVAQLELFESIRGDVAAWLLFGFGIVYCLWGLYYALRRARLAEGEPLAESARADAGAAAGDRGEPGKPAQSSGQLTPWILFTIFLFGPCEPLIPMLMVPASQANLMGVVWVTFLFGLTTLLTMTTLVAIIYVGVVAVHLPRLQTWGHALAGSVVACCGASVLFMGL